MVRTRTGLCRSKRRRERMYVVREEEIGDSEEEARPERAEAMDEQMPEERNPNLRGVEAQIERARHRTQRSGKTMVARAMRQNEMLLRAQSAAEQGVVFVILPTTRLEVHQRKLRPLEASESPSKAEPGEGTPSRILAVIMIKLVLVVARRARTGSTAGAKPRTSAAPSPRTDPVDPEVEVIKEAIEESADLLSKETAGNLARILRRSLMLTRNSTKSEYSCGRSKTGSRTWRSWAA